MVIEVMWGAPVVEEVKHVKNSAKSRVLRPAPRKAFALRTAAFMAVMSAAHLLGHRDAAAIPGIPLFPNLDLSQPARLAAPAPAVLEPQQSKLAAQVGQLMQYPDLSQQGAQGPSSAPVWSGYGALPGAFQAPWSMPDTHFDPSFRVSYWNPTEGYKNTADAPWNYGFFGQSGLNAAIFDSLVAHVGKGVSYSPQPVWDPAALQALAGSAR